MYQLPLWAIGLISRNPEGISGYFFLAPRIDRSTSATRTLVLSILVKARDRVMGMRLSRSVMVSARRSKPRRHRPCNRPRI